MTLEIRILNFKKSILEKKPIGIVRYKFRKYMQEYDFNENSSIDKRTHRDLSLEYFKYMAENQDGK